MDSVATIAARAVRSTSRQEEAAPDMCVETPGLLDRSAMLMTQALTAAHIAPDIREDKVAAIKARLATGAYEIDPAGLANALLAENPGLFGRF